MTSSKTFISFRKDTLEQQSDEIDTMESFVIRCCNCRRLGHRTFECPGKKLINKTKSMKTSRPTKRTTQPHEKAPERAVQERLNHLIEEDGIDAHMVYHNIERTMEELPMSCVNPSVFPDQMPTTEEGVVNPELVEAVIEW
jgi:hypothetical protein